MDLQAIGEGEFDAELLEAVEAKGQRFGVLSGSAVSVGVATSSSSASTLTRASSPGQSRVSFSAVRKRIDEFTTRAAASDHEGDGQ